ncbi:glycosyltransferase family 4 protein [Desulfogranum japonicum]|uniref:glycosyltransferase family 4 protein n=1 Tax=Desulfogranum japonicum TaxID=231447 RepID=UPI000410FED7|nr:glycosyltransferase family 4 protein [Desulfogranum japonicum]
MKDHKLRILAVGMLPPPLGGQALMFQWAVEELQRKHDVEVIDLQVQKNIGESGSLSFSKLTSLARLIIESLRKTMFQAPYDVLYYCPSGPSTIGLLKDLLLLTVLRRKARTRVYHFHGTGGMAQLIHMPGFVRAWARRVFFRPDITVRCADVSPNDSEMCESQKDVILFNGIPDPLNGDAPAYRDPEEHLVLSYIGVLTREKGVFDIVEIARHLKERRKDFTVNLIGQGTADEVEKLDQLVQKYGLESNIFRRGIVSGEPKFDMLRRTTFFLFPTFFRAETQPLAVIEAMAMGIPAVVSNWRGLATIVDDGQNGAILPAHNPELYAEKICHLLDQGCVPSMQEAARSKYISSFTQEKFTEGLCRILEGA